MTYKEKLRRTKTIPVDLSKERIDERGYTYIDNGKMTHENKIKLYDMLDEATNEIERFLNNYDFEEANENEKKYLYDAQYTLASLNARFHAKLEERYRVDK